MKIMDLIEKFWNDLSTVKEEILTQLLEGKFPNGLLNKRFLCRLKGFRIYLVNGEFVRNNLETDFTMGSHHLVSEFIPKTEIWIDVRSSTNDIFAIIYHEIIEAELMKEGMGYEEAHAIATQREEEFRKHNFCEPEN